MYMPVHNRWVQKFFLLQGTMETLKTIIYGAGTKKEHKSEKRVL